MGKKVLPEVEEIVIRLSTSFSPTEIAVYTGLSHHTVERIQVHFRKHGATRGQVKPSREKRCQLRDVDVQVRSQISAQQ